MGPGARWLVSLVSGRSSSGSASKPLLDWLDSAAAQASRSSLPATAEPEQEAGELDKKPSVAAEKGSVITEQQREHEQLEQ